MIPLLLLVVYVLHHKNFKRFGDLVIHRNGTDKKNHYYVSLIHTSHIKFVATNVEKSNRPLLRGALPFSFKIAFNLA